MINERAHLIRRKDHHHPFDRFDPNPNPNANFLLKHHGFINWPDAGEPLIALPLQPQFLQQKDWVFTLASSSFSPSSSSSSSSSAPAEAREGPRFRPRVCEDHSTSTTTAATAAALAMRDLSNRTKVVVRHLPPALSESAFREQIELRFAGSFNLVTFYPGKSSVKGSTYSRAYIDFKHLEDVIEFHQEFNGHIFVNEKGTQYKALVEYAPHQRVAKLWPKKDTREGLILQDPEYLKFVEMLAKPVEYLPSAEVQLERKEAERSLNLASGVKEGIVITPLMEFVRQKRALKSMPQKSSAAAGKLSVRGGGSSPSISSKMLQKRGDRSRNNSMYTTGARPKEKPTYIPRCEENQRRDVLLDKKGRLVLEIKDKKIPQEASSGKVSLSNQSIHSNKLVIDKNGIDQPGIKGLVAGKKLVSEMEKEEFFNGGVSGSPGSMSDSMSGALIPRNHGITSMKNPVGSLPSQHGFTFSGGEDSLLSKPSQRGEGGGRLSRGASSSRTPLLLQKSDQQSDKDKHLPRSQIWRSNAKESNAVPISTTLVSERESSSSQQYHYASTSFTDDRSETSRQEGRRVRNKDRPDRPVWTVRRRGDVSTSLESPRSFAVGSPLSPPGSQRQVRGPRDFDSNVTPDASKPANKRVGGSSTVYGGHEKQVWVAKPGSGS